MRYLELLESGHYINKNESILDEFKQEIIDYMKKENFIYRGMPSADEFLLGDSTIKKRVSVFSYNYINMLTEVLPSWEGWPARTESFMCSTSPEYSKKFGFNVYIVIPLNVSKFAVCKSNDFNFSAMKVKQFNQFITFVEQSTIMDDITDNYNLDESPYDFINYLEEFNKRTSHLTYDDLAQYIPPRPEYQREILLLRQYGAIKYLDIRLNPALANNLVNSLSNIQSGFGAKEVWFSGRALMISTREWMSLVLKFNNELN
jgi:hypothetical protein